jgi:propionyl-CoA carboxylase beta chain
MQALRQGGPEHMAARSKAGALTARERVLALLDPDSFVELDLFVDGVVAGHGLVDGREVYVFSQGWTNEPRSGANGTSSGERVGAMHKISKVIDLALLCGVPVIGLYDGSLSGLGRLVPPGDASDGYSAAAVRAVMASGVVPQISAVMGPCIGGAAHLAALGDLVVMVKGYGHLAATGPEAARAAGEQATLEELGGAMTHAQQTGTIHLALEDERQCVASVRRLLSYLPLNNLEAAPIVESGDPIGRKGEALLALGRRAERESGDDIRTVIKVVADQEEFLELMPSWAENLVIGLARLGGRSVGVVANQPCCGGGRLDGDAAVKAARFIRLCDAFNLPVVTFVDTPGYVPGVREEHGGAVRHGAKLLSAYCEATVPKLTVITGRAYGEAYEVMGSKGVRADFCLAWSGADLRPLGLGAAARPVDSLTDVTAAASGGTAGGAAGDNDMRLYAAAEKGLLDDVIQPEETRPRLIAALRACISKREGYPPKKHGNIPL